MLKSKSSAKINVKVLIILIVITAAVITALFAARQIRRNFLSKISLEAGNEAYKNKDWVKAYKNYQEYIGRNPDNIEILKKYAEARLYVRPLEVDNLVGAISAYRKILQLDNMDETVYDKLAMLYANLPNYDELAYIARMRLQKVPNDKNAPLWLADALIKTNKPDEAQTVLLKLINDINDIESLSGKHPEYVQACIKMSSCIMSGGRSPEVADKALEWLNKAVKYSPESAEALVNRAKFYVEIPAISKMSTTDRLAAARKDLVAIDTYGTENPQIRFLACSQWLAMSEFDKASAQLQAVDKLSQETIEKYYLDIQDPNVSKYLLASEIALRQGNLSQAKSLADEALKKLTELRHRLQVLPSAINIYAATGEVIEARKKLDEYLGDLHKLKDTQLSGAISTYLQAVVAKAEGDPNHVIDILQPAVANNASSAQLWQMLAEAYILTEQPRQAIAAIESYLTFYPKNIEMRASLRKNTLTQGNWAKHLKTPKKLNS